MATNDLRRYHWLAIFGGLFLFLVGVAAYAGWYVYRAVGAGAVHREGQEIAMAAKPTLFWIAVGWPALVGMTCAFLALRLLILVAGLHKKGELFRGK